jgi:hypothetical protein
MVPRESEQGRAAEGDSGTSQHLDELPAVHPALHIVAAQGAGPDKHYSVRRDPLGAGSILLTRRRVRSPDLACRMVWYAVEVVHDQDQGKE